MKKRAITSRLSLCTLRVDTHGLIFHENFYQSIKSLSARRQRSMLRGNIRRVLLFIRETRDLLGGAHKSGLFRVTRVCPRAKFGNEFQRANRIAWSVNISSPISDLAELELSARIRDAERGAHSFYSIVICAAYLYIYIHISADM